MSTRKPKPAVRTHPFVPDHTAGTDVNGHRVCAVTGCGLPEGNAHHATGQVDADQAEHRRRIGEEGGA